MFENFKDWVTNKMFGEVSTKIRNNFKRVFSLIAVVIVVLLIILVMNSKEKEFRNKVENCEGVVMVERNKIVSFGGKEWIPIKFV